MIVVGLRSYGLFRVDQIIVFGVLGFELIKVEGYLTVPA